MKYVRKPFDAEARHGFHNPSPMCDFCASRHPSWMYSATRMSTGVMIKCWRWLACEYCAQMIEAGTFESLVNRMVRTMSERLEGVVPRPVLRDAVRHSLTEFHECVEREE